MGPNAPDFLKDWGMEIWIYYVLCVRHTRLLITDLV